MLSTYASRCARVTVTMLWFPGDIARIDPTLQLIHA